MTFYDVGKNITRFLLWFSHRITPEFEGEFPKEKGFVLACNHVSDLDPVILGIACPKRIRYMAKEELFRVPVLGFIIRHLGAFPVARGKGDKDAIHNAVKLVEEGGVLGIFPEGGRSKDGKLRKMKSGAVVVASQTGGDIVPAAILYGQRKLFHRRPVTVKFGSPIPNEVLQITGNNKSELRAANTLLGERIAGLLGVEAP